MYAANTTCVCCLLFAGAANAHNPHDPVLALGLSPDYSKDKTVFVATLPELNWSYSDILRSTDDGSTWTKLPKGMDNRFDFSAIRLSPNFPADRTIYAATIGDGIYASANGGDSWQTINTGLVGLNIRELKLAGWSNTDYALFAAPTSGGLFRRAASQSSWKRVLKETIKLAVVAPSPDFTTDQTVWAADTTGKLRVSTDGGFTWIDRGNPAAAVIHDMAIAPGGAKEIFLATNRRGIFYSANSGTSFTNIRANLPAEAVNNVAISPDYVVDRTVFCTTPTRSVYKSTNSGMSWTLYSSKAVITHQTAALKEFTELQVSNSYTTDGAVFLSAHDGLFASSDAGRLWGQWQTRPGLITGLALSSAYASDGRVMATNYSNGGLYSSTDRGTSWKLVWDGWTHPQNKLTANGIDFVPNHAGAPIAWANANHSQIGFTSDFGANWSVLPVPKLPRLPGQSPTAVYHNAMIVSPQFETDGELYLGTRTHGVIQSRDGGVSWRMNSGPPTTQQVISMAISPDYANDHTAMIATAAGRVWRTTSRGDSWSVVSSGMIGTRPGMKYASIAISPNYSVDHLVLVGTNNGVYVSKNSGDTWTRVNDLSIGSSRVIRQVEFSADFATDQQIFVTVRGRGLYRATIDASGEVTSSHNIGTPLLDVNSEFTEFRLSPTFSVDATILGASGHGIYRSTDGGENWTLAGSPGR
jgi:photosystem II stability/assembly factor-like uncharacterized protein